jgi:hypothetical protein
VTLQVAAKGSARVLLLWNERNAGAEANGFSRKAIVWGRKRTDRSLFVPLPREAWISGKSYPTGMESVQAGVVDGELFKSLALLL